MVKLPEVVKTFEAAKRLPLDEVRSRIVDELRREQLLPYSTVFVMVTGEASYAIVAEAAACAQRGGIAMPVLVEVLATGGGAGIALERLKPYLLNEDPSGLQFFMANALKDRHADSAWVQDGLKAGETVVLYPGNAMTDGQRVKARQPSS